ncbi:MAG TPA: pyridoxal-phosphate dependent enzyme [Candidatus Limnocylindrales bacterium]|nr:pyridoxal-phosphate dependent enzyme [Candidatus Limnocylindrales bacterium]
MTLPVAVDPAMAGAAVTVACAGCGAVAPPSVAFPARCPAARPDDDIDHLMARRLDLSRVSLVASDDPNPFIRYRQLFRAWHVATAADWSDEQYVGVVRRLDDAIAVVDGHGFRITPFGRADELSDELGFSPDGGVWVKDETDGVAGSHKARHLMGIMLELLVAESIDPSLATRPLAIASCGNAALAAAVVARAAGRRLEVFVPPNAEPAIVDRLGRLGAHVESVARKPGEHGDPTVRRLGAVVAAGAIPFTCQGPDDGLAIEGGQTLGYEIAEALGRTGTTLDRIVVQVGGGALASACAQGLAEARALGAIEALPRLDTVQTTGAAPLRRAFERVAADLRALEIDPTAPLDEAEPDVRAVLDHAARNRSAYMWPWESEPRSIAHGILDDETYDWLAVVRAMLGTGGRPVIVDEATLRRANDLAVRTTATNADETGTSGLAGLVDLVGRRAVGRDERIAVLFTGTRRVPGPDRSR